MSNYDTPPLWFHVPEGPRGGGQFFVDPRRFTEAQACTRSCWNAEGTEMTLDGIPIHEMPRQKAPVLFIRNPFLAGGYKAGEVTEEILGEPRHWQSVEAIPGTLLPKGTRIRFLRTITEGPCPDATHPGRHYATADDGGWIDRPGGCKEGHWVYWDGWPSAAFGAELGVDFMAETRDQAEARHQAIVGAKTLGQLTPLQIEKWCEAAYFAHCARNDVEPVPWSEVRVAWLKRARAKHVAIRKRWLKGHRP